jgi:hypothetical protein
MPQNLNTFVRFKKNPKSEIRNPKPETNPKYKGSKFQTKTIYCRGRCFLFWLFGFWSFEFVSNFVLRASDLDLT